MNSKLGPKHVTKMAVSLIRSKTTAWAQLRLNCLGMNHLPWLASAATTFNSKISSQSLQLFLILHLFDLLVPPHLLSIVSERPVLSLSRLLNKSLTGVPQKGCYWVNKNLNSAFLRNLVKWVSVGQEKPLLPLSSLNGQLLRAKGISFLINTAVYNRSNSHVKSQAFLAYTPPSTKLTRFSLLPPVFCPQETAWKCGSPNKLPFCPWSSLVQ